MLAKQLLFIVLFSLISVTTFSQNKNYVSLSTELINNLKNNEDYIYILQDLEELDINELINQLSNDVKKKTFWLNVYNGNIIHFLKEDKSAYENRGVFFSKKQVNIGGELFSFDDIEHGFIRGSKIKLSLGLLKNPFVSKLERKFRVNKTDERIHFAANCGAKSCPPVAVLKEEGFNNQLDELTNSYLSKNTEITDKKIKTSILFKWFKGDFGLFGGVKKFLIHHKVITEEDKKKNLKYGSYDWTVDIENFTDI